MRCSAVLIFCVLASVGCGGSSAKRLFSSSGSGTFLGPFTVEILLGNGDGHFRLGDPPVIDVGGGLRERLEVSDLDRDGALDIVLSSYGTGFRFRLLRGKPK